MKTQFNSYIKYTGILLCSMLLLFAGCSKSEPEPENRPPSSFSLTEVPNGATDVRLQPQLEWEDATDPDGDQVTYQIYLDTQNSPQTSIANNLGMSTFSIEEALQPATIYHWKVIAKDINGKTTESDISSFTTRGLTNAEKLPGKWFFESVSEQPPLSDCVKQSFYLFTEDLHYLSEQYSEDSNGDCTKQLVVGGAYEVESHQVKFAAQNGFSTWGIVSMTGTELVLDASGETYTFKKE